MRKWFFVFVLVSLFLLPLPVYGQNPVMITSLRVDIRPEYDNPRTEGDCLRVLVMYDIELAQDALGASISLRIPAVAGAPFALANGADPVTLNNLEYQRSVRGDWAYISFSSPLPYIRLEYYDDTILLGEGDARSFNYVWPGDYEVAAMSVLVGQPSDATQMQISPGQWKGQVNTDGLTIYQTEIGQVPQGEEIEIKINYLRSRLDCTATQLVPQSTGSLPQVTTDGVQWQQYIPWVLGILGAIMLGGGLFWYWKTGRQGQVSKARSQRPRPAPPASEALPAAGTEQGGYCHQCGNRTAATDRFCRVCGARLHT